MREVSPKELQKLNDKSFKDVQKVFRRRLREIAAYGRTEADFDKGHYHCEDKIILWLRYLGFKVTAGTYKYYITWPEEEDIFEKLRNDEHFKILTKPIPCKFTCGLKAKQEEPGTWIFDSHTFDYVCSECGKHLGYTTPYCPICGKKLNPIEGTTYDKD